MLGRHVFHDAGYHGFEFRYGRGADRFVGRRDVVCPVGQMDAPQVCRGGAIAAPASENSASSFASDIPSAKTVASCAMMSMHMPAAAAFAVGRVDLFECNQFARFELQPGDVVVRGAQRRRRFDDGDFAVARFQPLVVGASAVAEERDGQQRKYPRFHFAGG